jgi:hypothetical protein
VRVVKNKINSLYISANLIGYNIAKFYAI